MQHCHFGIKAISLNSPQASEITTTHIYKSDFIKVRLVELRDLSLYLCSELIKI